MLSQCKCCICGSTGYQDEGDLLELVGIFNFKEYRILGKGGKILEQKKWVCYECSTKLSKVFPADHKPSEHTDMRLAGAVGAGGGLLGYFFGGLMQPAMDELDDKIDHAIYAIKVIPEDWIKY